SPSWVDSRTRLPSSPAGGAASDAESHWSSPARAPPSPSTTGAIARRRRRRRGRSRRWGAGRAPCRRAAAGGGPAARMVAEVKSAFERIDIGVANSGVASRVAAVHQMDPGEWRRVMTTDLDGAFYTARAVLPALLESRGVLLFISSVGADMAAAGGAPY